MTIKFPDIQIKVDPLIPWIIRFYYASGIWKSDNGSKLREIVRVPIFWFCAISYPFSLIAGGLMVKDDLGDSIFLCTLGLMVAVIEFKGYYVFFKQDEILSLIKTTCTQSVPNDEVLLRKVRKTLNISQKCTVVFLSLSMMLTINIIVQSSPLFSNILPYNIWFPFDYKSSRAAHWMAHGFLILGELFVTLMICLSAIMWCTLINCSVTYEILGFRLKHVGSLFRLEKQNISREKNLPSRLKNQTILKANNQELFQSQLIECIRLHKHLDANVDRISGFFAALLFVQIGTSALSICGSVYFIATDSPSELYYVCIGLLFYAILDIFLLMYLGNEVKVSSSKLLYCLFKSNWMEQSKSCKSNITILGEVLKREKVIMVAKLYPLTLLTFTSIMRGAYSMFNILNRTSSRMPASDI